ncbi:MAG: PAS domain-containing sensor histidine kinase [Pelagibacteraceae bacterium]|nr:MAG: PAS domain-containing sensor histidine kinase [Pelagibacteraceae bacterium]
MISIFITLFSLTVYSLISSNEIVRNAELIQYILIADFVFLLILLLYLSIFLINYLKYKNREVVGLRLFNKFFLFFGLFSIIPSGIILLASAIFFNIEVSTWLGPAFKSTVNNSYQLAQKYINQTERDLITDSKFIRNYVLAERLIDRDIIQRFNITTVYNYNNGNQFIEHISDEKIFLSDQNLKDASAKSENDITIFFSNDQLFSKVNLNNSNYLLLLKNIDLETLNYYQNIIQSYEAINSIDNNKRNIQITFFTIYIILSTSLIFIFIIIGTNFSFRLAKPIRDLNNSIIDLRKGKYKQMEFEKSSNKDDISVLTNSFHEMSKTIIDQKNNLQEVNATINDQLSFINNIIENSPYGIFVLNNKSMIFENSASTIFSSEKNTSFENFTKLLSNHFNNSQNFYKKSYEINLEVKLKNIQKYFFVKSIFIDNNSLFDQIIIFNDYTDLIFAEKNNAIADLARKISHEIKNPLTPMLLSTEFIESQLEDEELINSIKSIKRQIFLIQNLVNEFSTYARLPKANITKLNLSEICLVYIEEYKRNYDKIEINHNIEENLFVNFDHSYLDIIFNNLFKNSIEALVSTNNPAIDITLKKIDKKLILTFFDNGPGYDGDIDDLIKPYFSTKNSSGLGLSLINKIITDNSYKMNITTNSYSGFKIEIIFYD